MPFSSTIVRFNPYRISLLDKCIPVPWRVRFRWIPGHRIDFFGFSLIKSPRQTLYYWRLQGESISHSKKEIPKNKLASVGWKRLYDTNISDAWGSPPSALSKAFNTQTCYLTMGTTFFPSIDTARSQRKTFLSVKTPGDHMEQTLLYASKYLVGVPRRTYAKIGACWLLHEVGWKISGKMNVWCRLWVPEGK